MKPWNRPHPSRCQTTLSPAGWRFPRTYISVSTALSAHECHAPTEKEKVGLKVVKLTSVHRPVHLNLKVLQQIFGIYANVMTLKLIKTRCDQDMFICISFSETEWTSTPKFLAPQFGFWKKISPASIWSLSPSCQYTCLDSARHKSKLNQTLFCLCLCMSLRSLNVGENKTPSEHVQDYHFHGNCLLHLPPFSLFPRCVICGVRSAAPTHSSLIPATKSEFWNCKRSNKHDWLQLPILIAAPMCSQDL